MRQFLFSRSDTGEVTDMPFGEYLKGVVAAEMPASFHDEALKAQAVAARSYTLTRMQGYKRDGTPAEHNGAMTCTDSTHCKAWLSEETLQQTMGRGLRHLLEENFRLRGRDNGRGDDLRR